MKFTNAWERGDTFTAALVKTLANTCKGEAFTDGYRELEKSTCATESDPEL